MSKENPVEVHCANCGQNQFKIKMWIDGVHIDDITLLFVCVTCGFVGQLGEH